MAYRLLRYFCRYDRTTFGNYIKSDAAEQLEKLAGTVTPAVTQELVKQVAIRKEIGEHE